ncbi:MAG TPA: hypothetical protein VN939_14275 [Chthoniobacterales bacterium]|nr:hypothetical protein [Chthoniobacterales bacterium]
MHTKDIWSFKSFLTTRVGNPEFQKTFLPRRLREMGSIRFGNPGICFLRVARAVFVLVSISTSCCYAASVVLIRTAGGPAIEQEQIEIASAFYGLDLKIVMANPNDDLTLSRTVRGKDIVGVVIAADALTAVNRNALLRALRRRGENDVPLLILGGAPDTDASLLETWSGGAVLGYRRLESRLPSEYSFGRIDGLTAQLGGLEFPYATKALCNLELNRNAASQTIASVRQDQRVYATFIEAALGRGKIFMACAMPPDENSTEGEGVVSAFARIAPAMMFLRYCAGERGWHTPHLYANFTIDDPWLRQPYGYVDYELLLGEMEKHDFHTTIAFIPWNFDRSQPGPVSLFRNHPERFSIAVHGDNHDHKEFTDYRSKPLAVQIAALKQSLARMERFRTLTGIPYDRVMVFPHSIAPERTLEALKTYNYLATINATNVPLDAARPSALPFDLRPFTLLFAEMLSISRYPVGAPIPREFIAINAFLGNPLLFYAHSEFFAKGIDAFDRAADEVNNLEPDIEWRSLGEIVSHLYLIKLKDDSNYDVLAFSNRICFDNVSTRDSTFYVRKQEIGHQIINSVTIDGLKYPYRLQDGYLGFTVPVSKGNARCIEIQYENDMDIASIGTSKDSSVVYFLRIASDIRDIYLSKYAAGLAFIDFYNKHELTPTELIECLFLLLSACAYAGYRVRGFVKKRDRRSMPAEDSSPANFKPLV